MGESIVKAAIDSPTANILFYSANPNYKLIDFACKDTEGRIFAFQATTSLTHSADETEIAALEKVVGDRGFILYYLHPARPKRFKFATDPARPRTGFCRIFHVAIQEPTQATPSQPETGVIPAEETANE